MTPEGRVKSLINRYLDTLGDDLWRHMPVQSRFGRRTVDYHCCFRGWFFTIEAKAPGEEPTKAQWHHMGNVEKAGGAAFWIDGPERLEFLKEWIELVDNAT
jgi:hypothetical protein